MTPWTTQSMEFSRPEYWSGQWFPSPRDLPNPGIEPRSPALQVDSLPTVVSGKLTGKPCSRKLSITVQRTLGGHSRRWLWFLPIKKKTLSPYLHPFLFLGEGKKNTLRKIISLFGHSVMSSSFQPHGMQHTRPPCPLPTPGVYSNSCPLSQ